MSAAKAGLPASQTYVPIGNLAASPWRLTSSSVENVASLWTSHCDAGCPLLQALVPPPWCEHRCPVHCAAGARRKAALDPGCWVHSPAAWTSEQWAGKRTGLRDLCMRVAVRPGGGCVPLFLTRSWAPLRPCSSSHLLEFSKVLEIASRPHSSFQFLSLSWLARGIHTELICGYLLILNCLANPVLLQEVAQEGFQRKTWDLNRV